MNRRTVLEKAASLIDGDRAATYGDATTSHQRIADLWTTYLEGVQSQRGHSGLNAADVAAMMVLMKVSRTVSSDHADNWVDICGYAALASEMEDSEDVS